jgi:hypothetical protein
MQTIKNIRYDVERKTTNGSITTFCTIHADLSYILNKLDKAYLAVLDVNKGQFNLVCKVSREAKIFTDCLAHLGFSYEHPTVVYVTKITLHKEDTDNENLARKIVMDKAHNALVKQVADALFKAIAPTQRRLVQLEALGFKLLNLGNNEFEY